MVGSLGCDSIRNEPQQIIMIMRTDRHIRGIVDGVRFAAPLVATHLQHWGWVHGDVLVINDMFFSIYRATIKPKADHETYV